MSRPRASAAGGYDRKTISLPPTLSAEISKYLKEHPDLTMSSFMTRAAEQFLNPDPGKKKK
jgi:hypothetical protein